MRQERRRNDFKQLSECGGREGEVPKELVKFLKFVGALPSECEMDFEDAPTKTF